MLHHHVESVKKIMHIVSFCREGQVYIYTCTKHDSHGKDEDEVMEPTHTSWRHRLTAKEAASVKCFGVIMDEAMSLYLFVVPTSACATQ